MSGQRTSAYYLAAAALPVLVGLALTVNGLGGTRSSVGRIRTKTESLNGILRIEQEQATAWALADALEREGATRPVAPRDLAKQLLPGAATRVDEGSPAPLGAGWSVRTADVTVEDIAWPDAGRLMAALEAGRPPWRITSCALVPAAVEGRGRLTLGIEALEKAGE